VPDVTESSLLSRLSGCRWPTACRRWAARAVLPDQRASNTRAAGGAHGKGDLIGVSRGIAANCAGGVVDIIAAGPCQSGNQHVGRGAEASNESGRALRMIVPVLMSVFGRLIIGGASRVV